MKDIKEYTKIELNHEVNKLKEKHDAKKLETDRKIDEILEMEKDVNNSLAEIKDIESDYVELMQEYINRE